jgi:hypothetical protein
MGNVRQVSTHGKGSRTAKAGQEGFVIYFTKSPRFEQESDAARGEQA